MVHWKKNANKMANRYTSIKQTNKQTNEIIKLTEVERYVHNV